MQKNLKETLLFVDIFKAFDAIRRGKIERILLACGLPPKTVITIMMLYKAMKAMVCAPNDDTGFFDIVTGTLQG